MTTISMRTDEPAAGVQMNQSFRPATAGAISERHEMGSGTKTAKKPCKDGPKDLITELLGDSITTTNVLSRNLDLQSGYPHTTTGIPYSIQGSAKVISVKVGEYLASFSDPIKAILSTNIHKESRVIITRKYVVGGRAMIVPEHAPARVVALQEDVREVNLTRYGGDIEMNLNLFLRPEVAREELAMKVDAQRRELERVLVDIGYEMLMTQGTDLVDAIIRSSPMYSAAAGTTNREAADAAERINVQQVFGALSKHSYPVANLMSAARYASAYSTSNEKGSVMILPHGVPDILKYTRPESMVYELAGPALLAQTGEKINMTMKDAYQDPSTSVKILIHRQLPTFENGVANPDVGQGGLTDLAAFGNFYVGDGSDVIITDFEKGSTRKVSISSYATKAAAGIGITDPEAINAFSQVADLTTLFTGVNNAPTLQAAMKKPAFATQWKALNHDARQFAALLIANVGTKADIAGEIAKCTNAANLAAAQKAAASVVYANPNAAKYKPVLVRRRIVAMMSSAILAAPGESTGSLLIGYPFTSVSTSSQEIVKIQMRTYLGSVLRQPENVLVLRNVFFEGLTEGHRFEQGDDIEVLHVPIAYLADNGTCINFADFTEESMTKKPIVDGAFMQTQLQAMGILDAANKIKCDDNYSEGPAAPTRLYRGTEYDVKNAVNHLNCGHMGALDHYRSCNRLYGGFVYDSEPDPRNTRKV